MLHHSKHYKILALSASILGSTMCGSSNLYAMDPDTNVKSGTVQDMGPPTGARSLTSTSMRASVAPRPSLSSFSSEDHGRHNDLEELAKTLTTTEFRQLLAAYAEANEDTLSHISGISGVSLSSQRSSISISSSAGPEQIERLKHSAESSKVRCDELGNELRSTRSQMAQLKKSIKEADRQIEEDKALINDLQGQFSALSDQHESTVAEKDELASMMEAVQQSLATATAERDTLHSTLEELREQNRKSDVAHQEALAALKGDYETQLQSHRGELDRLTGDLHEKALAYTTLQTKVEELMATLAGERDAALNREKAMEAKWAKMLADKEAEHSTALEKHREQAEERLAQELTNGVASALDETRQSHEKILEELRRELAVTKSTLDAKVTEADELTEKTADLSRRTDALTQELEAERQQSLAAVTASSDSAVKVATLESQLQTHMDDLNRITKELHEKTSAYDALTSENATLKTEIETLAKKRAEADRLAQENNELSVRNRVLNEELEKERIRSLETTSTSSATADRVAYLEAQLKSHREEISTLERQIGEKVAVLSNLTAENEHLRTEVAHIKEKNTQALAALQETLESERNKASKTQASYLAAEDRINDLKAQLESSADGLAAAREELSRKTREIADLTTQNEALRVEIRENENRHNQRLDEAVRDERKRNLEYIEIEREAIRTTLEKMETTYEQSAKELQKTYREELERSLADLRRESGDDRERKKDGCTIQ